MKEKICVCGGKLSFVCTVGDGDEIWRCPECESEYIYNTETDELYTQVIYKGC